SSLVDPCRSHRSRHAVSLRNTWWGREKPIDRQPMTGWVMQCITDALTITTTEHGQKFWPGQNTPSIAQSTSLAAVSIIRLIETNCRHSKQCFALIKLGCRKCNKVD